MATNTEEAREDAAVAAVVAAGAGAAPGSVVAVRQHWLDWTRSSQRRKMEAERMIEG